MILPYKPDTTNDLLTSRVVCVDKLTVMEQHKLAKVMLQQLILHSVFRVSLHSH